MSFSFFRPKSELGIIFDIGSASVGAGLVRFQKGVPPHILYTHREKIPMQKEKEIDPDRFFKDMVTTLSKVNHIMQTDGLSHLKFTPFGSLRAKHVTYVFRSPWSATQTHIATIDKPAPFVFTKTLVDNILAEQEKQFAFNDKLAVIERRVVQITLNGYALAMPYGRKTRHAEVSVFMSLLPKMVIEESTQAAVTTYHPKDTRIHSFPLVSYSMIRDVFHDVSDFILLDVGGELSDISVVKKGLLLETTSFPSGKHFLTRTVAAALATSYDEAKSILILHFKGHADVAVSAALEPILKKASSEWLGALDKALAELSGALSLPQRLFAIIDGDLVPFFMLALKEEKVRQFGVFDTPFIVTLLNPDKFKALVTSSAHAERDSYISLIAAFTGRTGALEGEKR